MLTKIFAVERPLVALQPTHAAYLAAELGAAPAGAHRTAQGCRKLEGLDFRRYQFVAKGWPVSLLRVTLDTCKMEGASLAGVDLEGLAAARGRAQSVCPR